MSYESVTRAAMPPAPEVNMSPETVHGGVVRVSTPAPGRGNTGPSIPTEDTSGRVHYGVIRDDGTGAFARHDGSNDTPTGQGVMSTLRNNFGGSRIDASSTVEVGGMRTSLAVAASLGLVRETYPGHWIDTAGSPEGHQQGTDEAQQEPQGEQDQQGDTAAPPELFDDKTEADFAADIEPLPQAAYESAKAGGALAVVNGDWESVADNLAAEAGINPDLAAEYVEAAYGVFEGQVAALAQSEGLDEHSKLDFYSYAQEKHPAALKRAVQDLTSNRRLDGFRSLLQSFKARTR